MTQPDVGDLIRRLHEARGDEARAKKDAELYRKMLLPILEGHEGPIIDEVSGLKAWLEPTPRWTWTPEALHALVKEGVLMERDFAGLLETVVDKKKVEELVNTGVLPQRHLNRVAKTVSKASVTLKIERIEQGVVTR